ncbi:MAG TPA: hypothetical protein VIJ57_08555 [Hanamia sp.]
MKIEPSNFDAIMAMKEQIKNNDFTPLSAKNYMNMKIESTGRLLDYREFRKYSDTFIETGNAAGDGLQRALDGGFQYICLGDNNSIPVSIILLSIIGTLWSIFNIKTAKIAGHDGNFDPYAIFK